MAILKKVRGKYSNDNVIQNLVGYIMNFDKMPHRIYGGQGIFMYDAAQCIEIASKMFCINGKQAEHYVLSFTESEINKLTPDIILCLGYEICEYFENRQAVFACHEIKDDIGFCNNQGYVHIHFVVSTCNLHTGKMNVLNYNDFMTFAFWVSALLEKRNISFEHLIKEFN